MAKVFVSHASNDRELAHQVHRWLSHDGHQVFLDQDLQDGIAVGEAWEQRLYERLRWADAVVCVVTSAYLASPWCTAEVGIARSQGSRLLPLLAEPGVAHPLLTSMQYANLERDPVAARAALGAALRRVDVAGGLGWPDDRSPFPGLKPFDMDQHRVFFGRAAEIETLAGLLRSPAERAGGGVLLVVGPSGCGKSSLVRAGLVPVMTDELGWWTLAPFLPAADPLAALTRELAAGARQVGLGWTLAQVRDRLHDHGLGELAEELLLAAPGEGRRRHLLMVVDQFEELLTQASPATRARFAELLRPALDNPIQVVATLRPEFLAQLLVSPELASLPTRLFTLRPLRRDALATVIEKPARLAGIEIDEQLVDRLVADTDSGDALPLLAFTLAQLAEGVGRGGQLSATRYEQLGGVQGALVRQADAALADARGGSGRSADAVIGGLLRLVTVDEQGHPTRWRVDRDELPEPLRAELDAFVARRLLTTDTDNGAAVIGVTHEAFLSAWPPLAAAITAAASGLRIRRAVEQAAADWDADGRPPDRLWERGQLAAALNDTGARTRSAGLAADQPPDATSSMPRQRSLGWLPRRKRVLVTDRVELSQRARDFLQLSSRRDRRRRRRATTVLSTLLVLAIAAAAVAVNRQRAAELQQRTAQEQQRIATARQLLTQADVASDPHTALLLRIAAHDLHADRETHTSLMHTLATSHYADTLTGHTNAVASVAFAPDGRTLATASADKTVRLWDATDPAGPVTLGRPLAHGNEVYSVAFSPDGRILATGGLDKTVRLWDVRDRAQPVRVGEPLAGHTGYVSSVVFAPDGRTLATASADKTVRLWDVTKPAMPTRLGRPLAAHSDEVRSVAFSPDGRSLATGSVDESVILWDVTDRAQPARLGRPLAGHTDGAFSVAFAPDGRTLAAGSADKTVRLWDVTDRARLRQVGKPLTGHSSTVVSVAFSPDGRTLASASADKTVRLWGMARSGEPVSLTGHGDAVASVAFAPDGRTLATASLDKTVILWEVADRAEPTLLGQPLTGHTGGVYWLAFAPDGRTLATGSIDKTVILWDVTDLGGPTRLGQPLTHGPGVMSGVMSVAFSPDGRTLATGSADKTVILWDVTDRARPARLGQPLTHAGWVTSVAFAPDGRTLAAGSDAREKTAVVLWDVTDRARPRQLGSPLASPTPAVAFSLDRRTLATGGDVNTVVLWDVTDRARPTRLGQPLAGPTGEVRSLVFASDGHTLAAHSEGQTMVVWDVTDRSRPSRVPLVSGTASVNSVAVAPDGHTVAIGSVDGSVILWDVTDPAGPFQLSKILTNFGGSGSSVSSVAFSPDGRILASSGGNGSMILLWHLTKLNDLRAHAAQRACDLTNRGLNREEWPHYISGLPYRDTCAA